MHIPKPLIAIAGGILLLITIAALSREGLAGMATPFKASLWTWQYFIDLVIALGIFMFWMWRDCKSRGKSPLPWIFATFFTGSLAPLAYLYLRQRGSSTDVTE